MDTVAVTPTLTMLRVRGWQLYVWRDGDSVTVAAGTQLRDTRLPH